MTLHSQFDKHTTAHSPDDIFDRAEDSNGDGDGDGDGGYDGGYDGDSDGDIITALPSSFKELEQLLHEEGINTSAPAFQRQITNTRRAARQTAAKLQGEGRERPESYTRVRDSMLAGRDIIAMATNFILVVLGIPVSIFFLFVAEVVSTNLGIRAFLSVNFVPEALSFTIVAVYFALTWYRATLARTINESGRKIFSLRLLFGRFFYTLGIGSLRQDNQQQQKSQQWKVQFHQPLTALQRTDRIIAWSMAVIVLLGVLGRLGEKFGMYTGLAWHKAIIEILANSNLADFLTYIGGGLISWVLLLGTNLLLHYVNDTYGKAVGADEVDFFDPATLRRAEQMAVLRLYKYKITQARAKRELQATVTIEPNKQIKQHTTGDMLPAPPQLPDITGDTPPPSTKTPDSETRTTPLVQAEITETIDMGTIEEPEITPPQTITTGTNLSA